MIVGSGVDVIEIARLERALARHGGRFEARVFTDQEIAACRGTRAPSLHFAVRFAAKEAAMKAVGTGWARGVHWRDVEVEVQRGGVSEDVSLALRGRAEALVRELSGEDARLHLAVSRNRTHALAVVLLEAAGDRP